MPKAAVSIDTRRKPAAGFASQAAACAVLSESGLSPHEIAQKIERHPNHVRAILRRLSLGERPRSFNLPTRVAGSLAPAAAARGLSPLQLATQLLEQIVRDDLFEALLGEPEGQPRG